MLGNKHVFHLVSLAKKTVVDSTGQCNTQYWMTDYGGMCNGSNGKAWVERRRLTGAQATICEHYDGRISILVKGEQMDYKVSKRGEQPKPVEDEKTLNHRVDQAVKQRTHKPKATHPWKKLPVTEGGYRDQA